MPDFREVAANRFSTDLLETKQTHDSCDVRTSTTIFVHIRLLVAQHYPSSHLPPRFKSRNAALAWTAGRVSIGSRGTSPAETAPLRPDRLRRLSTESFPFVGAREAYRHFECRGHLCKAMIAHR